MQRVLGWAYLHDVLLDPVIHAIAAVPPDV
jgi:hypothetical protein